MASFKGLKDLQVEGRRVLLRVDLDSVMDEDGTIVGDEALVALLPTISELRKREARIVLASGVGRPRGRKEPRWSLEPLAARLAELIEARDDQLVFSEEPVGDGPRHQANSMKEGHILFLENLRFNPGEVNNDDSFARMLAGLADIFVNDGFASMSLPHASSLGVPRFLRERGVGLLVEKELAGLAHLTERPQRPMTALVGGQRIAEVGTLLMSLALQADVLCVAGGVAMPLLWCSGVKVGPEPDSESLSLAEKVLRRAKKREALTLVLPRDFSVAQTEAPSQHAGSVPANEIAKENTLLDIGEATVKEFSAAIADASTVFWCGTLGVAREASADRSTALVGKAIARCSAYSIVGGPDSLAAIRRSGAAPFISHLSHGGESTMLVIEGKPLPGLVALGE